ncbi:MAG TPA: class I SAM-dependent methyltransferase [Terriglobia bacterium]|nr:class I SAM-dependent methyltransferase [Terriglobia bacterium]
MTPEEKLKVANQEPGWMYEFDLGDGVKTPLLTEELRSIHSTREQLILPIVDCFFPGGLGEKSCLDIACNEGYFSHLLYQRGATVRGIDIRETNIRRARWVQNLYGYDSNRLVFEVDDFFSNRDPEGKFDLTLFLGILYHIENPMGALRLLSKITRRLSVIETQLTRQNTPVSSGWGQTSVTLELDGVLALNQETDMDQNNLAALGSLSLIPNASAVRQMLFAAGFSHVLQAAAKPGLNPQYVRNDRAVFFAMK